MPLELPEPIAEYFASETGDAQALAQCFADSATVRDEEHIYSGLAAIMRWRSEAAAKYTYTNRPFACEEREGRIVVTSRLTGTFPGGQIDLRFFFELNGDRITSLEIKP